MKTRIQISMVALFGLLISNNSLAQFNSSESEEDIKFGLKAGVNFANIYDESGEDFVADGKIGGAFGAFLSLPIGKVLGFQPEIMLSQRGFTASGTFLGSPYEINRTTTHLDIPLLFALRPTPVLSLFVGPQYSYLLNQKDSYQLGNANSVVENEFKNDNIRRNTLSFIAGADVNLNHLVLGGRFGVDLQENRGDGTSSSPRYKNIWLQATVGYRF